MRVRVLATERSSQQLVPIPSTPVEESLTWGSRMWQLRRAGESVVFEGRSFFWHIVVGLLLVPVVYGVCGYRQASANLQFGLTLFPLFYAGGMAVGILVVMRVPRLEIQPQARQIVFPTGQTVPFAEVMAIQLIQRFTEYDEECFSYQANLCYQNRGKVQRLCLAQSYDENSTAHLARRLAELLNLDVQEHYQPREVILSWYSQYTTPIKYLILITIIGAVLFIPWALWNMAQQADWSWSRLEWVGIAFPIIFLPLGMAGISQQQSRRDRLLQRAPAASASPGTNDQ